MKKTISQNEQFHENRRNFLYKGSMLLAGASIAGLTVFTTSCNNENVNGYSNDDEDEGELSVSPNEDLMREHGLLQRMLIIYDYSNRLIDENKFFDPKFIHQTASIIRDFIEDYHEKLEEQYVFPRLRKANRLNDLVNVLVEQHAAGRKVTDLILSLSKFDTLPQGDELVQLMGSLKLFTEMYRPHEAREDTVLFPEFKKVVTANEYAALGEDFEQIEHEKFGQDGFDEMVGKVAEIEKQMGIYDLRLFTPEV